MRYAAALLSVVFFYKMATLLGMQPIPSSLMARGSATLLLFMLLALGVVTLGWTQNR
jgi:hypothetical protein